MNVQAFSARLASVRRINRNQFNTIFQAFVAQKHSELKKCPTVTTPAFGLVSRQLVSSFPNPAQVFNRNYGIVLKCRQDNQFTDVMVQPCLISFFSARQPLQNLPCPTASRPCASSTNGLPCASTASILTCLGLSTLS